MPHAKARGACIFPELDLNPSQGVAILLSSDSRVVKAEEVSVVPLQ